MEMHRYNLTIEEYLSLLVPITMDEVPVTISVADR